MPVRLRSPRTGAAGQVARPGHRRCGAAEPASARAGGIDRPLRVPRLARSSCAGNFDPSGQCRRMTSSHRSQTFPKSRDRSRLAASLRQPLGRGHFEGFPDPGPASFGGTCSSRACSSSQPPNSPRASINNSSNTGRSRLSSRWRRTSLKTVRQPAGGSVEESDLADPTGAAAGPFERAPSNSPIAASRHQFSRFRSDWASPSSEAAIEFAGRVSP